MSCFSDYVVDNFSAAVAVSVLLCSRHQNSRTLANLSFIALESVRTMYWILLNLVSNVACRLFQICGQARHSTFSTKAQTQSGQYQSIALVYITIYEC